MLQTLAEDRKKKEKDPEFMKNEQKLNASVQAVVEKKKIKKYATIVEKNFNQDQAESNFGVINEESQQSTKIDPMVQSISEYE